MRLHYDDGKNGEYAILIRSRLKGQGLGWLLMTRIVACARALHLKQVHGFVLAENSTMLRMCAEFGFQIKDDDDGPGLKRVSLALTQPVEAKVTELT